MPSKDTPQPLSCPTPPPPGSAVLREARPSEVDPVDTVYRFHEPHPRGKIPFTVARRHGRRLSRTYGWFGGMFVLKK